MSLRRPLAAAATAAVLAPLLALAAGTANAAQGPATDPGPINVAQVPAPTFDTLPSNPSMLQLTRRDQCMASYNVNYWVGGMPFALTQLKLCLSAPATLVRGAQIYFPGDVNYLPGEPVLVPTGPTVPVLVPTEPTGPVLVPGVPLFP
ncbi:hypothetical protein ACIPYS_09240 [Kitasatospora sp. NPDC089913]|uniref:hypothetical protein n=1 Tax=Streptomycetaceae TaxID=2062 RepID=UPI00087A8AB3|nr:hypothetical protein [Streptomyces sp. TLI_053]SDS64710.1 hypothetical protein SAMN05216371_0337 [Streptomyces sp. TLI_053]